MLNNGEHQYDRYHPVSSYRYHQHHPTDNTSTTGAVSRLINSLNVQCLLRPIVGAKSRLPETFDLKVSGGKPLLSVKFEKM